MKKNCLIVTALFIAQLVFAKEITIIVRGTANTHTNTQVTPLEGNLCDTLIVDPAINATAIYLSLKDVQGNVHQQCCLPATSYDILNFDPSTLPTGYMLEIADDRGFVFSTFGN